METNIWFYTFSTSAQVMAALVGLFAVFVVYKMQEFSGLLSETREATVKLLTHISANTKDYDIIKGNDTISMSDAELLKKLHELVNIQEKEPQRIQAGQTIFLSEIAYTLDQSSCDFFSRLIARKQNILKQLKKTLILCFIVIALSVLFLVMTDLILHKLFLYGFVILFLYVLFVIARGIYNVATQ